MDYNLGDTWKKSGANPPFWTRKVARQNFDDSWKFLTGGNHFALLLHCQWLPLNVPRNTSTAWRHRDWKLKHPMPPCKIRQNNSQINQSRNPNLPHEWNVIESQWAKRRANSPNMKTPEFWVSLGCSSARPLPWRRFFMRLRPIGGNLILANTKEVLHR